jgi:hypothetical protein
MPDKIRGINRTTTSKPTLPYHQPIPQCAILFLGSATVWLIQVIFPVSKSTYIYDKEILNLSETTRDLNNT